LTLIRLEEFDIDDPKKFYAISLSKLQEIGGSSVFKVLVEK